MTWIYLNVCLIIKHLSQFLIVNGIQTVAVWITAHLSSALHTKMTICLIVCHHIVHDRTHSTRTHSHFVLIVIGHITLRIHCHSSWHP